jgi:uroporphyrinogen decarboxylase
VIPVNSKEIILKTINLEKTPRLPVALLSGGVWTLNRQGLTLEQALEDPDRVVKIMIETNQEVQSDIVWAGSGYHNLAIRALGGRIKFRSKGAPDVLGPLVQEAGELEKISLDYLEDDPGIIKLCWITDRLNWEIGSDIMVGASQWGPMTLAGHIFGVEKLMRGIYKDPDTVHRVLEFTTELCCRYLKLFIDAGAQIVSIADPTSSGDLISRQQFTDFALPYLKKAVVKLNHAGAAVSIHICGNITNRLDLIPTTGAQIISVDYKVDLSRVRENVGFWMAFAGNMNPVAIMQNSTPAEVMTACYNCIAKAGSWNSYILMPGCDIPPGVPLENIQAMVRAAREWPKKSNTFEYMEGI